MENPDQEELDELNAKTPADIIAAATATMERPCRECNGRGIVDYLRFMRAPWYLRIWGVKNISRISKNQTCKHCAGTGKEVPQLSTDAGVDAGK